MNTYEKFIQAIKKNLQEKEYDDEKKKRILIKIEEKYKDSYLMQDDWKEEHLESHTLCFTDGNCFGEKGAPNLDKIPRTQRVEFLRDFYAKTRPAFLPKEMLNPLNEKVDYGRSQLHLLVLEKNLEKIKELVDAGANPYVKDNNGHTPLVLARLEGLQQVILFLMALGVDH